MNMLDTIQKLQAITQLVTLKATGTPKELARKLGISESTLYRLLKDLKELNANIRYNFTEKHYEFIDHQKFVIGPQSDDMQPGKEGKK